MPCVPPRVYFSAGRRRWISWGYRTTTDPARTWKNTNRKRLTRRAGGFGRIHIVAFGWGAPLLGLIVFCVYLVWPHSRPKDPVAQPPNVGISRRNPRIPVEVSYPVIDEVVGFGGTKRTIYVRLNTKVSEEVLREIALELKSTETKQYEYTRITFFLPGEGARPGPGKTPTVGRWPTSTRDFGL